MWTSAQQSRFEAVMDEFQKYDNTAGFFIGNEILTDGKHELIFIDMHIVMIYYRYTF